MLDELVVYEALTASAFDRQQPLPHSCFSKSKSRRMRADNRIQWRGRSGGAIGIRLIFPFRKIRDSGGSLNQASEIIML